MNKRERYKKLMAAYEGKLTEEESLKVRLEQLIIDVNCSKTGDTFASRDVINLLVKMANIDVYSLMDEKE